MKVGPEAAAAQTAKCTSSEHLAFEDTRRNMAAMLGGGVLVVSLPHLDNQSTKNVLNALFPLL